MGEVKYITFEDLDGVPFEKILEALEAIGCGFECRDATEYVEALEHTVERVLDSATEIFKADETALCMPLAWKEKYQG